MIEHRTLSGLLISVFLMMTGVGMIVAQLPLRIMKITGSSDQVGLLASAFAVSYILFQVPVGALADRKGFKGPIVWGYLLCGIAGTIYAVSQSAGLIFVGRMVQGLGEIPVWALAPALLSITYPHRKGRAMGIYNAVFHMGLCAGPLLGMVLQHHITARIMFLIYSACCLMGAVVSCFMLPRVQPGVLVHRPVFNLKGIRHLLLDTTTLSIFAGIALYGAGYGASITIVPAFLFESGTASPLALNLYFCVFYLAVGISQITAGVLSDRYGRMPFVFAGLLLAALSMALFSFLDAIGAIVLMGLAGFGMGIFNLSSMAFLNDRAPDTVKGMLTGTYFLFWGTGYFSGPFLMRQADNWLGSGRGFMVFSFCLFLQTLVIKAASLYRGVSESEKKSTGRI